MDPFAPSTSIADRKLKPYLLWQDFPRDNRRFFVAAFSEEHAAELVDDFLETVEDQTWNVIELPEVKNASGVLWAGSSQTA